MDKKGIHEFRLLGLMSGTSLDGLDIADVTFRFENEHWNFQLNHAETVAYDEELFERLVNVTRSNSLALAQLSVDVSLFYANAVKNFIYSHSIKKEDIYAIASHGQTIFHQPEKGLTLQIGNLPHLATQTGIRSIVDFRTKDVSLGGNGAPLIPIVDHYLFKNRAEGFLNLGGFSNLSYSLNDKVYSFDVTPVNIVINYLMRSIGKGMDEGGALARSGNVNSPLLNALNDLPYYKRKGPKSLGWEWVESDVLPLFANEVRLEDQLHTYCIHIANQMGSVFNQLELKTVLATGGGVYNSFLVELLREAYNGDLIVPENSLIDYKEAIGFAFLGLKRALGEINVLSSVTGAKHDSCSGVIFEP